MFFLHEGKGCSPRLYLLLKEGSAVHGFTYFWRKGLQSKALLTFEGRVWSPRICWLLKEGSAVQGLILKEGSAVRGLLLKEGSAVQGFTYFWRRVCSPRLYLLLKEGSAVQGFIYFWRKGLQSKALLTFEGRVCSQNRLAVIRWPDWGIRRRNILDAENIQTV